MHIYIYIYIYIYMCVCVCVCVCMCVCDVQVEAYKPAVINLWSVTPTRGSVTVKLGN
jgi:hypothetical protein